MNRTIRILAAMAVLLLSLNAQTIVRSTAVYQRSYYTLPGYTIPSSLTCIVGYASTCKIVITKTSSSSDPAVCMVDFTANGQTVVFQDLNGNAWINAVIGTSGTPVLQTFTVGGPDDSGCRVFPGGLYIQATGSGTTTLGQLVVKFNP